jgi:hypothetical protein
VVAEVHRGSEGPGPLWSMAEFYLSATRALGVEAKAHRGSGGPVRIRDNVEPIDL